jgi:hypothetical protein|nr:hypothetical protein [Kofleriaceae bacterium]
MKTAIIVTALATSSTAAFAQAPAATPPPPPQTEVIPADANKAAEKTDIEGWAPFLTVTGTVALADNSSVVGQVDGFSTLLGLGFLGGTDYVQGPHLFRSTLAINEGFAKTPVVDDYIKTNDVAKLDGIYNYFITKQFGVFGRLGLATSLFDTTDIRGTPTSWVEVNPVMGQPNIPLTTNGLRQPLSDAFKPFSINESAGVFADPVNREEIALSIRAGIGGRHTFADGVLVNADDKTTPEVELTELQSVEQLGLEGFVGGVGKLDHGKANYKAGLSILFPFVNDDKFNRTAATLTRVAFEGSLTFNVYSWMGLVYNLNIIRDPGLFSLDQDKVQIQNTLLLTFALSVVKKPEKPKEPTKDELELKAAKDRADSAEKKYLDEQQKEQDEQKQLQLLQQQQQQTQPQMPAPPTLPGADQPQNPQAPQTPPTPPTAGQPGQP